MMALLLGLLLTTAPADAGRIRAALEAAPAPAPGWVMHAVRVGVTKNAKRSTFIADASLGRHVDIAFAFWVLRGYGRVLLIDCGFVAERHVRAWRVENYRDPAEGLVALGLAADQVTDVVITHHHWDHIGGLALFPRATVWIDGRALARARKADDAAVTGALREAKRAGRLRRTQSLDSIAPGVIVVHTGMHTAGFQFLVVDDPNGVRVFASDIVPLRANLEKNQPTGLTTNRRDTLAVMATMRDLVNGDLSRIVTGHDPEGFDPRGIIHLAP